MTLRLRIAAVASAAVALSVLAAAVGLYVAVRSDLRGEIDQALRQRARVFMPPARAPGGPGPPVRLPPSDLSGPEFPDTIQQAPFGGASYVQFIAPDGSVHVPLGQNSASQITLNAHDRAIAHAGVGSSLTDRQVKATKLRVFINGLGPRGAIMVARPLTEVDHELNHILLILTLLGIGGIILAAVLGALIARTALRPITRFTEHTERLTGKLDLSQRLQVKGRDELARLAESFNVTLDALERSVQAQRHLIADASHELRTPIASLRANIQILGDAQRLPESEQIGLRQDIIDELDELTALISDVVELARSGKADAPPDDLRLDEIVEDIVQRTIRRAQLQIQVDLEPTMISAVPERVVRAVSNLLDNARKWSPSGGVIEVDLHDGVLSVRDHGPGFKEEDLPYVFERFYRADAARKMPGSGLGLAIVRQAAEASGGFVQAQNAPDGGALLKVSFGAPIGFSSTV